MDDSPHAPWALVGESVVVVVPRGGRVLGVLAAGLSPLPGPGVLVAARYQASPIGPFCELSLIEPARIGGHPGWSVTLSVVDDARARAGGRLNWGVPRDLGALAWDSDGTSVRLSWRERGLVVHAERRPGSLPVLVPLRLLQRRGDGPVVVPVRLRGIAHRARVIVEIGEGDPLAPLGRARRGAVVSGQRTRMSPARQPAGIISTLLAPLRPVEPGVAAPGLVQHGRP